MDIYDECEEPCEQCGLCCKIFGDGITPTITNLYRWLENGRHDILQYFSACKEDGTWVNCSDLKLDDLGDIVVTEMRDPISQDYLSVCPFLHRFGKRRYLCGIHDIKPEMCGNYKPWIWGETYFNQCKALMKLNRKKH